MKLVLPMELKYTGVDHEPTADETRQLRAALLEHWKKILQNDYTTFKEVDLDNPSTDWNPDKLTLKSETAVLFAREDPSVDKAELQKKLANAVNEAYIKDSVLSVGPPFAAVTSTMIEFKKKL